MTTFPARDFARAWLAVSQACSDDDSRPALTGVLVENYPTGVRLVATDSYMLLHAFVPAEGHEFDVGPSLGDEPVTAEIVLDPDGRAAVLFGYALRLAKQAEKDGAVPPSLSLRFGPGSGHQASFDGLEARVANIDLPDTERITLGTFDGDYPSWRPNLGSRPAGTKGVVFAQPILSRVLKAARLFPQATVDFTWAGSKGPAWVEFHESEPFVSGIAMPIFRRSDKDELAA